MKAVCCSSATTEPGRRSARLGLGGESALVVGIVLAGLALRAWILAGPLGEVEADESVVGLMALHILRGERPAFYWGQPYLGSLEAYLVALAFALAGPSNLVLKLVPALSFLGFALLLYLGARRDYGRAVALASLCYLAVPPSFLAFWSVKARGGYVELLTFGQALLLVTPWAAGRGHRIWPLALTGLLSGGLVWIHLLGWVFVLPSALYLAARTPGSARIVGASAWGAGALVGLAPLLAYNLGHDWATWRALSGGDSTLESLQSNLRALLQVGVPIMVGLGQATTSPTLFAADWPTRPGSQPWIVALLLVTIALLLAPRVAELLLGQRSLRPATDSTRLGLGLLLLTPILASLGRFGELVAEPRYALPLYAGLPVLLASLLGWPARTGRCRLVFFGCLLALNISSLTAARPELNLPTSAAGSTAANRSELLAALEQARLREIYTDYWLASPLMFESGERVSAAVTSGGYDRLPANAHLVANSPRPALVFIAGSAEETRFLQRSGSALAGATVLPVSIYRVYYDLPPVALPATAAPAP